MKFALGQRVQTTIHSPTMWPGGLVIPIGSLGTITRLPKHSTSYGVLLDDDPYKIDAAYAAHELEPAKE